MPRVVELRSSQGGLYEGLSQLLYGPDSDGALDATEPVQTGKRAFQAEKNLRMRWLEHSILLGPWLGVSEPKSGFLGSGWLESAWTEEPEQMVLVGEEHEHGVFEYAARIEDELNNLGTMGATASVLVRSSPGRYVDSSLSVAAGVVTMTITEI